MKFMAGPGARVEKELSRGFIYSAMGGSALTGPATLALA